MNTEPGRKFILSIETSTPVCSVALHSDSGMAGLSEVFIDRSHSQNLVPMIQDLLKYAGAGFEEIKAVAVSKGPGSYTGLRIGASTAKGICFAHNIPLIGISTLEALAEQVISQIIDDKYILCPMLDARRMEVYTMLLGNDGKVLKPVHAKILEDNAFEDLLMQSAVLFFGPGSQKCKPILQKNKNAFFMEGIVASAKTIGKIATGKFKNSEFEDTSLFEPFYLKEFLATVPKSRL
jgi:tRNA threonylcarbamoyladenosine biosynthesis protein TsaB